MNEHFVDITKEKWYQELPLQQKAQINDWGLYIGQACSEIVRKAATDLSSYSINRSHNRIQITQMLSDAKKSLPLGVTELIKSDIVRLESRLNAG
jgi:hypothetical protein